jgi:translation initiation factor IF-1
MDDVIFEGKVVEVSKDRFKVVNEAGSSVEARLSGKMRMHKIRVLLGDSVSVKVSPYDLSHGMIISRNDSRNDR